MQRVSILLIIFLSVGVFSSCDHFTKWFCGELSAKDKKKLDQVNALYGEVCYVEYIPCETFYLNLYLQKSEVDTTIIGKIHYGLYNEIDRSGWPSIDVYDSKRNYLFSHNYDGKINFKH